MQYLIVPQIPKPSCAHLTTAALVQRHVRHVRDQELGLSPRVQETQEIAPRLEAVAISNSKEDSSFTTFNSENHFPEYSTRRSVCRASTRRAVQSGGAVEATWLEHRKLESRGFAT